jgi:hypothetical protein
VKKLKELKIFAIAKNFNSYFSQKSPYVAPMDLFQKQKTLQFCPYGYDCNVRIFILLIVSSMSPTAAGLFLQIKNHRVSGHRH